MNSYSRSLQWLVWGTLAAIIAVIVGMFAASGGFHPAMPLPIYAQVGDFSLTNQFARRVSLADVKGSIWLADVIFTRCPGPCAAMTRRMREIQSQVPKDAPVQFLSLSADPEYDTPEVLKAYAFRFGAAAPNWQFLTGPKKQLYDFAIDQLKFSVIDNGSTNGSSLEDRFLHSTQFILIDDRGRIRGSFDGTDVGARDKVLKAIRTLLREKSA